MDVAEGRGGLARFRRAGVATAGVRWLRAAARCSARSHEPADGAGSSDTFSRAESMLGTVDRSAAVRGHEPEQGSGVLFGRPDGGTHRVAHESSRTARAGPHLLLLLQERSEERRVGKECRSRLSPYHYKKKEMHVTHKWRSTTLWHGCDVIL